MTQSLSDNNQPRPYGRRSAILLFISSLGLLAWALTSGDNPSIRLSLVGGVISLTIVAMSIRYTFRTIKEQRTANSGNQSVSISVRRLNGNSTAPEPYKEILNQLNAAVNNSSYLHSVLLPNLEEILAQKKTTKDTIKIFQDLKHLSAISKISRWRIDLLLQNRRKQTQLLISIIQKIELLP